VARNDVILAEAGDDVFDGSVAQTARELMKKKPTPGYEFHTQGRKRGISHRLKSVKFHVYDHCEEQVLIWVFAAVYDPSIIKLKDVQSFLEKIVAITEVFRESEEWKYGDTLACQASFAPILLQRMQEVTYYGRMALLEERLDATKALMQQNIEEILEREAKLEALNEDATRMQEMAAVFKKQSNKLRRLKMMQNAKHGLIMGTAITAGVAVVVVPPLIAIL